MVLIRVICAMLLVVLSAHAEDAAQVLKQSKAATALVILPEERGSGSGFCIDSSGLFITNAHVVKSIVATESVTLVLNPGDTGEKVIRAKVVASDVDRDLALLQASDGKDFAPLILGSVQGLTETQQLTVLGFPFGGALSVKNRKYPNISVNIVHISSLRKSDSTLEAIQVDSQLNPGNSGGPVVDASGRVVGVLSSGIVGGGINFAIPVSDVTAFLSTPRIVFTPPIITEDKKNAPYDVSVGVVSLDKDKTPLTVQVVINPGTPKEQTVNASPASTGQYKARVIPASAKSAGSLRVAITLPDGQIKSTIDDATIKLDDKEYKLSALSQLQQSKTAASVTLKDGTEISGKKLTLGSVKATMAGQPVQLDGSKIEKIIVFSNDDESASTQYKIVVKRGDKVVAEETTAIGATVASARETEPATQASDAIMSRLEDAKEQHKAAVAKARQRILGVIEARSQAAANKGDLDVLKSIEAAKQSVETDGKLPEGFKDTPITGAMGVYTAELKQANARLTAAYQQAIRDYTKSRKTAEAEAVKTEMAESGVGGESASTPLAGFMKLGGTNRLPSFLEPNANAFSEGTGLQLRGDNVIRTKEGTWLTQDFTLDILYSYKPGAQEIGVVGIGQGWNQQNILELRIHSPGYADGHIAFKVPGADFQGIINMTSAGPHLLRIEKKDQTLTASICVDYKGTFTADATRSIADIKTTAPFLTAKNTYIFFGRPGLIFQEIRLVRSGTKK